MTQLQKILGTSTLSLILVIWGLFMVCSGHIPDLAMEDDWMTADEAYEYENGESSELTTELATFDEEDTKLEEEQRREILEALGIDPEEATLTRKQEEDFLTEELFLDLEVEIAELEKMSKKKLELLDSLQLELEETDHQLMALRKLVNEPTSQFASSRRFSGSFRKSNGSISEFAMSYQDALDDVYDHQHVKAITRFRELLRLEDTDNLADNCQYWIGECYYAMGNFEQAVAEFEKVFAFENNNKADDAQFMIGMALIKLGDLNLAQLELQNLLTFYQQSEYAARAERQLFELNI
ncbi:MAG: tol-pal system YbgF family protein [bacterium]